ncbi:MAG: glutamine amidotransferase [Treponema sp.]|nr:glutamine amidotransferase [Treponema sp.]
MITIYVYLLATLADWEIAPVTAELNSKRFFKAEAPKIVVKTVSLTKEPVTTMGGLTIIPDGTIDDIEISEKTVLLLPGADTWADTKHDAIIQKASALLSCGGTVCAICGATVALANAGFFNERPHTSNGKGFLEMFCTPETYSGQKYYVDQPAVRDGNLITASATGALPWAKLILEKLGVFSPETLDSWYAYFTTGKPEYFFALMQSIQKNK